MIAFVGNPPFLGGGKLSGAFGAAYLAWLLTVYAPAHGNADLCAFFFRRAYELMERDDTLGFVATNTISQGDTRLTGLRHIVTHGGEIYNATTSLPWPGGAAVCIAKVHLVKTLRGIE
jgi:hypothetical protein